MALSVANGSGSRVAADGTIATVAGGGSQAAYPGAAATSVAIDPGGITALLGGGFLLSDDLDHRVWSVSAAGLVSLVAGDGRSNGGPFQTPNGDGGPATAALIDGPGALAAQADVSVLVRDDGELRRVGTDGRWAFISEVAGDLHLTQAGNDE